MTHHDQTRGSGHRMSPHTADLIIEAWAPSRDECLAEAVVALRASFVDIADRVSTKRHYITLSPASDDELLVTLLEEALYVLTPMDKCRSMHTSNATRTGALRAGSTLPMPRRYC